MKRSVFVVAVLVVAVGCGRLSDAERAAAGANAQKAITNSNAQTHDASQLGLAGQGVYNSLVAGDATAIDISGLPAPTAPTTPLRPRTPVGMIHAPVDGMNALDTTSGCIVPDTSNGAAVARYDSYGTNGCTANDHVEVTYADGDQVSYTFTQTSVTMSVHGGSYAGTHVTYTFADQTATSAFTMTIVGALVHSGSPQENIQFNRTFHEEGDSNNALFSWSGLSTDLVAQHQVDAHFQLTLRNTGGGNSGSFEEVWSGDATISTTDAAGAAKTDGQVKWQGINVTYDISSTTSSYAMTYHASGNVLYNGNVVGVLATNGNNGDVEVHWSDGVVTPYDFSAFFNMFGP